MRFRSLSTFRLYMFIRCMCVRRHDDARSHKRTRSNQSKQTESTATTIPIKAEVSRDSEWNDELKLRGIFRFQSGLYFKLPKCNLISLSTKYIQIDWFLISISTRAAMCSSSMNKNGRKYIFPMVKCAAHLRRYKIPSQFDST